MIRGIVWRNPTKYDSSREFAVRKNVLVNLGQGHNEISSRERRMPGNVEMGLIIALRLPCIEYEISAQDYDIRNARSTHRISAWNANSQS